MIVVQKYGGSSVASAARIKRVAERIAKTVADGARVCVVVSAMANTTDELLARAAEITESPSRRELDMLLSCGERASMALLSMAVSSLGLEAISFTGSQCGIMTNDRHWGARIVEVRPFRVSDELERGRVVIVAGFQGVSYKREITTLGRGGSDTTAVALAAALGAAHCEICSDVDGVYTADPRIVSAAKLIDAISHDDMLELASHGARVLHPEAVEFAKRSNIALWAKGTSSDARGTRIDRPSAAGASGIGVTSQHHLLRLESRGPDRLSKMLDVLGAAGVPGVSMTGSDDMARVVISEDDAPDWQRVRKELEETVANLTIAPTGAVSVVGGGVGKSPSAAARALAVAQSAGIAITAIAGSPLRITLQCAVADVDPLTRALHAEFVESTPTS